MQQQPQGEIITNFPKLSIYVDNKHGRTSILNWSIRNGYPRITISINGADRSVTGRDNMIIAPFTFLGINTLIGAMTDIVNEPNGTKYSIQCYNTKFVDGKKTDEVTVQATVIVGKDDNGIIFLGFKADDKPNMRFDLNIPLKWFKMQKNGEEISGTALGSKMFTKNYVEQVKVCLAEILQKEKEVRTPGTPAF